MFGFKLILVCLAALLFTLTSAAPVQVRAAHKRCAKRAAAAKSSSAEFVAATNNVAQTKSPKNLVAAPTPSSSKSASADEPESTGKETGGSGAESLDALFPLGRKGKSWTTSEKADDARSLSDDTLRPTKDMKKLSHDITKAPDGKEAMEAVYPRGSMNPGNDPAGGISFYAPGPEDVDLTSAKEVTFGYSVFFEDGFDWVKGGKLPGVYGGNSDEEAVSCSGGRRSDACFSARMMWRGEGAGEFYNYFPPSLSANKKQCNVAPESDCNDVFGASVGRGAFSFKAGGWTTVSERVRLNDVGEANGAIEMFANGKSVIKVEGLELRSSDKGKFRGIQMQTFFGGSHAGFEASKDSKTWFKDFSMAITETL